MVERQSEVSDVVYGVLRLHHGAQCHGLYEVLLALALARRHERVERLGESTLRAVGSSVAELHHELAQRLELCRVGVVVHTIKAASSASCPLPPLPTGFSHGAVGDELLNELVGILRAFEVAKRTALPFSSTSKCSSSRSNFTGAILEACGCAAS